MDFSIVPPRRCTESSVNLFPTSGWRGRPIFFLLWLVSVGYAGSSPAGVARNDRTSAAGTNLVRLEGKCFRDAAGPFLGLGASYFQALRDAKYDHARLNQNLVFLASKGFNYVRILSMVSWDGLEIAPVTFTNRSRRVVRAWPDYWERLRELLILAGGHGLRVQITIFADAQTVMPSRAARQEQLERLLASITGLEDHVMLLEVANEGWQNGFPGPDGTAELREYASYLATRTPLLIAITSSEDTSDRGIIRLYKGSGASLATVHFSRDTRSREGGWFPVRDAYRAGNLSGVPPVISNEPIGPGSSVGSENDSVKLCAAAVFGYLANLPGYVFHSRAGVYGFQQCCPPAGPRLDYENAPGIGAFQHVRELLPPDLPNWTRNNGTEPSSPFTVFCNSKADSYWPDVANATNGCVRNIGSAKGNAFVCLPMGIHVNGVKLEARRALHFEIADPITGVALSNLVLRGGESFTLARGPGAYVLKGEFVQSGATAAGPSVLKAPYPHSSLIEDLTWDWNTYGTAAPGSDLWPVTWGPDDNLYAAWGDGGGFGGSDSDGRVAMGLARIEGGPEHWRGVNVNGGKNPEHPASFARKGKTTGIAYVDGVLYATVNLEDGPWPNVDHVLTWSTNAGATWSRADWLFPKGDGNFQPAKFLNFGRDYTGLPSDLAGYVYIYGPRQSSGPGSGNRLYLARAQRDRLREHDAYEFFSGTDSAGIPRWAPKVASAQAVFIDRNGVTPSSVVYVPALKLFLLTCFHVGPGELGVFDSRTPSGPWTTIAYYENWGEMGTEGEGLTCGFPQKWMSADGLTLWSVFSVYGDGAKRGIKAHDRFNLVKASLRLKAP